jgi:hypothetical protein
MSVDASDTWVACTGGARLRLKTLLIANIPTAISPTPTTAMMIPMRTRRFKVTLLNLEFYLKDKLSISVACNIPDSTDAMINIGFQLS